MKEEKMATKESKRNIIYVDGSASPTGGGYGVYSEDLGITIRGFIPKEHDPFRAEQVAACIAIEYVIENNIQNAVILTDNIGIPIEEDIKSVCSKKQITITWIPREINGNADALARDGRLQRESWVTSDNLNHIINDIPKSIKDPVKTLKKSIVVKSVDRMADIFAKIQESTIDTKWNLLLAIATTDREIEYINLLRGTTKKRTKGPLGKKDQFVRLTELVLASVPRNKIPGRDHIHNGIKCLGLCDLGQMIHRVAKA